MAPLLYQKKLRKIFSGVSVPLHIVRYRNRWGVMVELVG